MDVSVGLPVVPVGLTSSWESSSVSVSVSVSNTAISVGSLDDTEVMEKKVIHIVNVHFEISLIRLPTSMQSTKEAVRRSITLLTRSQDSCPFISRVSRWVAYVVSKIHFGLFSVSR